MMNIGLGYFYAQNYAKALSVYQEVYDLREKLGGDVTTTQSQLAFAVLFTGGEDDEVIQHLKPVLRRAIETNAITLMQESIETIAELFVRRSDYERAAEC